MALAAAVLPAFAGCFDEVLCAEATDDTLAVAFYWDVRSSQRLAVSYGCEMVDNEFPVDRYVFQLDLPQVGVVEIRPKAANLSQEHMGSGIFHIGLDGVVAVSPSEGPHYIVNMTGWDPEANGFETPQMSLVSSGFQGDWLPRGEYRQRILLSNGADDTGWVVWSSR